MADDKVEVKITVLRQIAVVELEGGVYLLDGKLVGNNRSAHRALKDVLGIKAQKRAARKPKVAAAPADPVADPPPGAKKSAK